MEVRSPCFLIQSLDLYLRSNLKSCSQYLHSWQSFPGTNSQNHHLKETHHQTLHFQIDYFRNHFCYILRQFIFIAPRQSKHLSSSQVYLRTNLPSRLLFIHLGQSFKLGFATLLSSDDPHRFYPRRSFFFLFCRQVVL